MCPFFYHFLGENKMATTLQTLSMIAVFHNKEHELTAVLDELLQGKNIDQLILIDADSTDNTRQKLYDLTDGNERCQVYHVDDDSMAQAFNFGLEKVTSDLVMFLYNEWHHVSLDEVKIYSRLTGSDLFIFNEDAPRKKTTLLANPYLLKTSTFKNTVYTMALIRRYALTFNEGKDSPFIFHAMSLLASDSLTLLYGGQQIHNELLWNKSLTYREWQHFMLSFSWLLKAALPISELYDVFVSFILNEGLDLLKRHYVYWNREEWYDAVRYFAKFLHEQHINFRAYPLSYQQQLMYHAIEKEQLTQVRAFVEGHISSEIIVNQGKYMPKIRWHRPLIQLNQALTAIATLHVTAREDGLYCEGEMALSHLPLIDPFVEITLIHHESHRKIKVNATCYRHHIRFTLPYCDELCLDGEWCVTGQLYTGNIVVPLIWEGNQHEAVACQEMHGVYHVDKAFYLYWQSSKEKVSLRRFHIEEEAVVLSLEEPFDLPLAFVSSHGECVMGQKEVFADGVIGYRFAMTPKMYEVWTLMIVGYRHQTQWWPLVFKDLFEREVLCKEWQLLFKATEEYTQLTLVPQPTKAKVIDEQNIQLELDTSHFTNFGYHPVALVLYCHNHRYRYDLNDGTTVTLTKTMEMGNYQLAVYYDNGHDVLSSNVCMDEDVLISKAYLTLYNTNAQTMLKVIADEEQPMTTPNVHYMLWRQHQKHNACIWCQYADERLVTLASELESSFDDVICAAQHQTYYQEGVMFQHSRQAIQSLAQSKMIVTTMWLPTYFGKATNQYVYFFGDLPIWQSLYNEMIAQPLAIQKKYKSQLQQSDALFVTTEEEKRFVTQCFGDTFNIIVIRDHLLTTLYRGGRKSDYLQRYHLSPKQPLIGVWVDQNISLKGLDHLIGSYTMLIKEGRASFDEVNIQTFDGPDSDFYLLSDCLITNKESQARYYMALQRPVIFIGKTELPCPQVESMYKAVRLVYTYPQWITQYQHKIQKYAVDYHSPLLSEYMMSQCKAENHYHSESLVLRPLAYRLSHVVYEKLFNIVGLLPAKKTMVFESFYGKQYSDNPRALYEYAKEHYSDYHLIWTATKESAPLFEEAGIPYVMNNSIRALFVQARARYWILNTRMVPWKIPPRHTTVIQTWHGTPLKKLGLDIEEVTMPGVTTSEYYEQFLHDTQKWDYLIAPNEYSLNIFRHAFHIPTERMIPSGYPRNDVLHYVTSYDTERMKCQLGLDPNKKVILYAPTWRDDENQGQGQYQMNLALDIDLLREALQDEAYLLIRSHYLISQHDVAGDEFIIDVSSYPEISDLYIASDLLITDYSSVFFDYALLKRPMIFYAYDYDKYKENTRGFYFDYHTVPGPIVQTNEELLEIIQESLYTQSLHPNHLTFLNQYGHWEDGHAAEQVFDMVMNQKQWSKEKVKKERDHIILAGTGELQTGEQSVSLADDCGRMLEVNETYRLYSPLDAKAYGELIYDVSRDDMTGMIHGDDEIRE